MASQQYFASLNHLLADRSNQSNSAACGGASHAAAGNSAERKTHATLWLTLLIGLLAALSAVWINLPLPWMMGPLLVVACLRMAGMPLWATPLLRNCAHVVIGLALGLYFAPEVVTRMAGMWLPLLFGLLFALGLSLGSAAVLRRVGLDPTTAYFAGGIGGATEMSVLSERYGGEVAVVIAVHTVRVMAVVVFLPFAFRALEIQGSDLFTPAVSEVHWPGLILLLVGAVAASWPVHRIGWPNAWMLGSLVVAAFVTASGNAPSALPEPFMRAGQLAIGITLGSRFAPETIGHVRRILWVLVLLAAGGIALATLFAALVAWWSALPLSTMVLATSPGGIAEMSLTARVLQLGVPVVTVFHVTRLVFMLLCYGALYPVLARRFNWSTR